MSSEFVRSAKLMAKTLGVSERTVREYVKTGKLRATKDGANTSPLIARREDIERLKRDRGSRRVA